MSDDELVKRLRIKADIISLGESIPWGSDSEIMHEAADAIERLAADNAILSKWHIDAEARAEAAERKGEVLREALGNISRMKLLPDDVINRTTLSAAIKISRAALAENGGQT